MGLLGKWTWDDSLNLDSKGVTELEEACNLGEEMLDAASDK